MGVGVEIQPVHSVAALPQGAGQPVGSGSRAHDRSCRFYDGGVWRRVVSSEGAPGLG